MSDSDLSDAPGVPLPPHDQLEQSLRREVVRTAKSGADVTVKRIRAASEKKLGLPDGFYKSHATWKDLSRTIIEDQVNNEGDVPDSPVLTKPKPEPAKRTKRKSEEVDSSPQNKRKKQKISKEDDSSESSLAAREDDMQKSSAKSAKVLLKPDEGNGNSDSDLSVLLDEEPARKKKQDKSKNSQDKPKQSKQPKHAKPKPRAKEDEDPYHAEIKRLQGWLVKCGIRKVWAKELSAYDTSKAKIKHLRDILSDVGMTGRFSIEKANRIKEDREMAADIEAIKEGEERWGAGDQDAPGEGGRRPARKLVRGSEHLHFLSDDGEETD